MAVCKSVHLEIVEVHKYLQEHHVHADEGSGYGLGYSEGIAVFRAMLLGTLPTEVLCTIIERPAESEEANSFVAVGVVVGLDEVPPIDHNIKPPEYPKIAEGGF